jgi:methanogenic corrinoid protein MtbC1/DNA-binding transcriptional ArsR family regulator
MNKSEILEFLRKRRTKEISLEELMKSVDLDETKALAFLDELQNENQVTLKKESGNVIIEKKTTKELIMSHLLRNREREVSVKEIAETYNLKRNTISNAIRELELKGKIILDRQRKKGQFTHMSLAGERTSKAITSPQVQHTKVSKDYRQEDLVKNDFQNSIEYLRSTNFNHVDFRKITDGLKLNSFTFIVNYVTPLMKRVGVLWEENLLSTGEEHIITERMGKLLVELINERNNKQGELVLLAPVENEFHTLALLSLELIFTDYNKKVINLGKPIPIEFFIRYIHETELPSWIFLSMTLPIYRGTLKRELKSLRTAFGTKIKIAIGGQGLTNEDKAKFPEANNIIISNEDLDYFFQNVLNNK